ncbi:SAM-dependent methyltransferase [Hymenobacter qilianensis]|uniref:SAM-dependent methyltransferase n=2 Tax=Hymenobacter qilianensis TaxID=1385715 RepID=A0ACB5PVW2_9BACT|nr:rRNA adenine N-6-methyltransferase family protein [Hymenobacter qilianensis]QNP51265.1 methyltransferase domain-containing protein [Hymenobacter qilianensis]GGF76904.1 SAM-dependent methyltransferase [Hymenobacter qilianensis]
MSSFLEEFLRNPAVVGSMVPSSRELTGKVMAPIDFGSARCIVEYGPGTGVFTDILIQRRKAETAIVLIEVNRRFSQMLKERYSGQPNVHIIHGSADKTGEYLQKLGLDTVDYVVCGLPFSSLPRRLGWRIMQQTQQVLLPDGKLILFQYSLQNKRLFERFFRLLDDTYVLLNIPPAHVLVYTPETTVAATNATEVVQNSSANVPA